jgi:hypothetical protein
MLESAENCKINCSLVTEIFNLESMNKIQTIKDESNFKITRPAA